MPDLPTSWGGLSLVKPKYDHLWFKRVLWSKYSRSINWIDLGVLDPSLDGLVSETNYGTLVHAALERKELNTVRVVEGFVPYDWLKETLSTRFSSNKLIFWTNGEKNRKSFFSLKSQVDKAFHAVSYSNWKVPTNKRTLRNRAKPITVLWRENELKKFTLACRATLEGEQNGYVYVPCLKLLDTDTEPIVKNKLFVDVSDHFSEAKDEDGNIIPHKSTWVHNRVLKSTRDIFHGAFKYTGSLLKNTVSEDASIE
jgi:hypothetical protein